MEIINSTPPDNSDPQFFLHLMEETDARTQQRYQPTEKVLAELELF